MATSYTTNLGLALPVQGELAGTWGDVVNNEITSLLDSAIAGTTTLSSDADVTLTDTDGAANQSRQAILLWTATGSTLRTITAPARTKAYIVINATGGSQSIKLVGAGPTTGVTVAAGEKCLAAWNGSDFVKVASTVVAPSQITGATTVGTSYLTLTNPSAITFPRMNADNTVSALSAADFRTAIGAGSGTGDVVGPASSTDNGIVAFSGTTGKLIKAAATITVAQGGTGATTLTGIVKGNGTSAFTAVTAPSGAIVGTTDTQTLTNKTVEAGTFTNGYTEEVATANTSTAYTINLANGSVQILTLTGNCTYTFPTATAGRSFLLVQKQDATGSRTVTWPAAVKWPASTAPTITSTASKADVFAFTADGTNWFGRVIGQNYL